MTKGFVFDPEAGRISFLDGPRVTASTDGTLVNLLPESEDYEATINVAFPDFTKDYHYHWDWETDYNAPSGQYGRGNSCDTAITVVPQEWSQTTILAAAPPGADILLSRIRINRTSAPANTWGGSAIQVLPKQNQWLPFSGSVLVEAELAMSRAFSLYISGGNLVLHRQQSVGAAPGGYGYYGDTSSPSFSDGDGGEHVFGTRAGLPVFNRDLKSSSDVVGDSVGTPTVKTNHRRGFANACAISDTTNYASTYSVEIIGKFGRRS